MVRRCVCLLLAGVVAGASPPVLASPASSDDPGPRGWSAEMKAKREEVLTLHNHGLDTTRSPADRAAAFLRALELAREQVQVGPGSYRRKMALESKLLAEAHYELTGQFDSLCLALELVRTSANTPELVSGAGARWGEDMQIEQARLQQVAQKAGAPCAGPGTVEKNAPSSADAPPTAPERPALKPEGPAPPPALRLDRKPSSWRVHVAVGTSLIGASAGLGAGFAASLGLRAQEEVSLGAIAADLGRTGQSLTPAERDAVDEANARYVRLTRVSAVLGSLAAASLIAGAVVLATRNRARPARAARLRPLGPGVLVHF